MPADQREQRGRAEGDGGEGAQLGAVHVEIGQQGGSEGAEGEEHEHRQAHASGEQREQCW
ncbi:hypothetical protein [Streptomyces atratus]|uniref:hypothetical protein n=1 Tax=Streptomyces atratus TaxID=1893 RepID=UPI00365D6F5F